VLAKPLETIVILGCAFGASLFSGLAFGHDCRSEPGAEVFRKFVQLGVAVDFDGLLGGIANNVAVVAPSQVLF
jgi:hypothetical protein